MPHRYELWVIPEGKSSRNVDLQEIGHKKVQEEPSITWQFDSESVINPGGFIENTPQSLSLGAYRYWRGQKLTTAARFELDRDHKCTKWEFEPDL